MPNRTLKAALVVAASVAATGAISPTTILAAPPLVLDTYVGIPCISGYKPTENRGDFVRLVSTI